MAKILLDSAGLQHYDAKIKGYMEGRLQAVLDALAGALRLRGVLKPEPNDDGVIEVVMDTVSQNPSVGDTYFFKLAGTIDGKEQNAVVYYHDESGAEQFDEVQNGDAIICTAERDITVTPNIPASWAILNSNWAFTAGDENQSIEFTRDKINAIDLGTLNGVPLKFNIPTAQNVAYQLEESLIERNFVHISDVKSEENTGGTITTSIDTESPTNTLIPTEKAVSEYVKKYTGEGAITKIDLVERMDGDTSIGIEITGGANAGQLDIPAATENLPGVMTGADKKYLQKQYNPDTIRLSGNNAEQVKENINNWVQLDTTTIGSIFYANASVKQIEAVLIGSSAAVVGSSGSWWRVVAKTSTTVRFAISSIFAKYTHYLTISNGVFGNFEKVSFTSETVKNVNVRYNDSLQLIVEGERADGTFTDAVAIPEATQNANGLLSKADKKRLDNSVTGIGVAFDEDNVALNVYRGEDSTASPIYIPQASHYTPGVMSADDKIYLDGAITAEDFGHQNIEGENLYAYGIEFDTEVSSPECTRIGNMNLHRTLPVHSQMRGCLLDDMGGVKSYLPESDWTSAVRDGIEGMVMVEIPEHWRKFVENGTKRQVWYSAMPLSGYHRVPKMYVSAYEAAVDRTDPAKPKLASVVNTSAEFRGGDNTGAWDGTYRSLLGIPATSLSRMQFRNYARNRNNGDSRWNCYLYEAHKSLYWLFVVEYATLNSQKAYNGALTSEGYRQGGLGNGVTNLTGAKWGAYNSYQPFIPCGYTDSLGNGTGEMAFTMPSEYGTLTTYVPRYRGVENPFGHVWKWSDGINVRISPTAENGGDGLSKVYVCPDPQDFSDSGYTGYAYIGDEARSEGFAKKHIFGDSGEMIPSAIGGGSTTYLCDRHHTSISTTVRSCGVLFGGPAGFSSDAGFACANSNVTPSHASAAVGSRLCFKHE